LFFSVALSHSKPVLLQEKNYKKSSVWSLFNLFTNTEFFDELSVFFDIVFHKIIK